MAIISGLLKYQKDCNNKVRFDKATKEIGSIQQLADDSNNFYKNKLYSQVKSVSINLQKLQFFLSKRNLEFDKNLNIVPKNKNSITGNIYQSGNINLANVNNPILSNITAIMVGQKQPYIDVSTGKKTPYEMWSVQELNSLLKSLKEDKLIYGTNCVYLMSLYPDNQEKVISQLKDYINSNGFSVSLVGSYELNPAWDKTVTHIMIKGDCIGIFLGYQ